MAATACGTRLEDDAFVSAGSAVGVEGDTTASGTFDGASSVTDDGSGTASGGSTSGGSGRVSGGSSGGSGRTGGSGGSSGGSGGSPGGSGGSGGGGGGGNATFPDNTASDTGITPTSITVGNITARGGPLGPNTFSPPYHGARAYFQALNEKGGVHGRKVKFLTCDDKESPDKNKQCARDLVEGEKIFAFTANSTQTYASASYVSENGVPDVGSAPIGNAYYKYPTLYAIYGSEGYSRDGSQVGINGELWAQTAQYRWFKQNLGIEKAAVFFYVIPISRTAGLFIADGLEREGIDVVYTPNNNAGRDPANPSWDTEVVNMRQQGVEALWHSIDISGFQKLCQAMDRLDFTVKAAVATVNGWGQLVKDFSSPCRESVYANGESVPYSTTSNPAIAEMLDAMKKFDPSYPMHQWVAEGWAGAKLLTTAIEQGGAAPTRKGVIQWLDKQRNYTINGQFAGVDWRREPFNWEGQQPNCVVIAKWNEAKQTFTAASDVFECITTGFYWYTPENDGS